jgi:hypothetical protein
MKYNWTPEQDEALRQAIAEGGSLERMSARFKRPLKGIQKRANVLGVAGKKGTTAGVR